MENQDSSQPQKPRVSNHLKNVISEFTDGAILFAFNTDGEPMVVLTGAANSQMKMMALTHFIHSIMVCGGIPAVASVMKESQDGETP